MIEFSESAKALVTKLRDENLDVHTLQEAIEQLHKEDDFTGTYLLGALAESRGMVNAWLVHVTSRRDDPDVKALLRWLKDGLKAAPDATKTGATSATAWFERTTLDDSVDAIDALAGDL